MEIGPGPGSPAEVIPAEPAINTQPARNAPLAVSPDADAVRAAAIDRLEAFADTPPETEAELEAVLADFTGWVTQEPNDAASQAGLAGAIVLAGAYNAGIDAGYSSQQLLDMLEPVTEIAAASTHSGHDRRALAALLPPGIAGRDVMAPAADFPDPSDPDFSSADLQIAVRSFLLPAIDHAFSRLSALEATVPDGATPLVETGAGEDLRRAYRGEVRALLGLLRLVRAYLLQACAWQFNGGDWDWNVAMADLDTDDDGLLTVDEYLPPAPYLWRHEAPNMASAGEEVRNGLELLIDAFASRRGDSMIEGTFGTDGADERLAKLRDLRNIAQREVTVSLSWTGGSGGGGTRDLRLNLPRLWSHPPDDLKEYMPTLELTEGGAWQALPRDINDFPHSTVNGIFPAPQPLVDIIVTGPDSVAISYGAIEEYPLIDRR